MTPTLIGRSSSHFTRVARIFAAELGIGISFRVVPNLLSTTMADYGGNPALRLPTLQTTAGSWFGTLAICRELARRSSRHLSLIWPEDLRDPLLSNAQELAVQAMTTEVALVMAGLAHENLDSLMHHKQDKSLRNLLEWLNTNIEAVVERLPTTRDLSYLEATLFCLITHLEFRNVVSLSPYPELSTFCEQFAKRESAQVTAFRFDS